MSGYRTICVLNVVSFLCSVSASSSVLAQAAPKRGDIQFAAPAIHRIVFSPSPGNLQLRFGMRTGEFVSDVAVELKDVRGALLLKTITDGPFLSIAVPPGRYQIHATFGERTLIRSVVVEERNPSSADFLWGLYSIGAGDSPFRS